MQALLGQITVILILVVIIIAILTVGKFISGKNGSQSKNAGYDPEDMKTLEFEQWKIQLLDLDTGDVLSEKTIPALGKGESFRIGRTEDCDFVIDNPHISKFHAKVVNDKGTYRIVKGKTNMNIVYKGTEITDTEITERMTVFLSDVFPCRFVKVDKDEYFRVSGGNGKKEWEEEAEISGFKTLEL